MAALVQKSDFGINRTHNEYAKSILDKDSRNFDGSIALRSLVLGHGRRRSDVDEDTNGVLASRTVEITRHNRVGDRNV